MSLFVPRSLEDNAAKAATEATAAHAAINLVGQHVDASASKIIDLETMIKAALLVWAGTQKDIAMIQDAVKKLTDQLAVNKQVLDQKDATIADLTAKVSDLQTQLAAAESSVNAAADQLATDDAASS